MCGDVWCVVCVCVHCVCVLRENVMCTCGMWKVHVCGVMVSTCVCVCMLKLSYNPIPKVRYCNFKVGTETALEGH